MAYKINFFLVIFLLSSGPLMALDEPPGAEKATETDIDAYLDRIRTELEDARAHSEKIKKMSRPLTNLIDPAMQAGGYARVHYTRELKPSNSSVKLSAAPITESNKSLIESAQRIAANNPTLALLMIEKGSILFETYNKPANQSVHLFSWSMSKSLTGYTIGNMHCDGLLGSLDAEAEAYSKILKGTVYGESKVTDLLKMSSGAGPTVINGARKAGAWDSIVRRTYTNRQYVNDFRAREKTVWGPTKSGEKFVYANTDTQSLAFIAESNGGLIDNFDRYIWSKIQAESSGYWSIDREGFAVSFSGFSATAHDWARLAIFSLQQLKSNNACISEFMQKATTPQIRNLSQLLSATFKTYGYQTWIGDFGPRRSYWWVGYGGQRIGIDPEKERIIIVFSWAEDYMDQIYDLFARWQRY